jgi:hypothetical protein
MEVIPEQEVPMPHEVILADAEPELLQLHVHHALMRAMRRTLSGWMMALMI